jgi:ubiquinone/menaquinone biosynthesis C-methylase UbiE
MSDINEMKRYGSRAAAGYDQGFAYVSSYFIPFLVRAARVAAGQRVLDIATGTGLAAEVALATIGPDGHLTAADVSPDMVEQAKQRLANVANPLVKVEDGQALSFSNNAFDSVLCSLGLMFFPDPARGLGEFRRVLRPGGRAAASVNTVPERSYNTRVHVAIARHVPSFAASATRVFSLGDEHKLRALFEQAGFVDVKMMIHSRRFPHPSFEAYFEHVERGWGSAGQAFVALPEETRRAVREDIRREVGDDGGPIEIEVEFMVGSGRKP